MVVIAQHEALLQSLGLATIEQVRRFRGELVKNHRGRRDIVRVRVPSGEGANAKERVFYLKRNLKPYRKDGWNSLLQRGRVWSLSRQEWENSRRLEAAGLHVAGLVAYGEECGWFREKFSYLITEAATGSQTVEEFLGECRDRALRRRVLDALAQEVQKLHAAGLASPDLFTRHWFVAAPPASSRETAGPTFCLIDMCRLDHGRMLTAARRARDLAALNITAPLRSVSARERLRFLKVYGGGRIDRDLVGLIRKRMQHLLKRRKFRGFAEAGPSSGASSHSSSSHS